MDTLLHLLCFVGCWFSPSVMSASCNPMDCSTPGFSAHGIPQARILEWVAISFSRGSSQSRDRTHVSCIVGRHFTVWATREACIFSCVWLFMTPWTVAHQAPLSLRFPRQEYWSGMPFPSPGDLPNLEIKPRSLASPVLSTCQCRRCGFNPWVRKIPQRRKWEPTAVFLPGEFHGWRSLAGYSSWGREELNTTGWLTLSLGRTYELWSLVDLSQILLVGDGLLVPSSLPETLFIK